MYHNWSLPKQDESLSVIELSVEGSVLGIFLYLTSEEKDLKFRPAPTVNIHRRGFTPDDIGNQGRAYSALDHQLKDEKRYRLDFQDVKRKIKITDTMN
ncbi:hypothetical protein KIN20_027747 [Parelaphostrongylus tenuis]|uniref:Uncharacterized protein n=1 Tax=Parelaphostrongylus tenuis TaxID=148309 RepID=A0AAD5QZR8_PARTN|nr:hypothetical protein KIN20_027747 [Parelaphostrongylus tenuis]